MFKYIAIGEDLLQIIAGHERNLKETCFKAKSPCKLSIRILFYARIFIFPMPQYLDKYIRESLKNII